MLDSWLTTAIGAVLIISALFYFFPTFAILLTVLTVGLVAVRLWRGRKKD